MNKQFAFRLNFRGVSTSSCVIGAGEYLLPAWHYWQWQRNLLFNNALSWYGEVFGGRGANRFLLQTTMPCHNLDMMNINFTLYWGVREKNESSCYCLPQKTDSFLAGGSAKLRLHPYLTYGLLTRMPAHILKILNTFNAIASILMSIYLVLG